MNYNNVQEVGMWIRKLIEANNLHAFYTSSAWLHLRADILKEYKGECQHCKAKGLYTKATTVHHVQYVRKHPELALSKVYVFQGKVYINLIALCHDCHEKVHGYRQKEKKKKFMNEERW